MRIDGPIAIIVFAITTMAFSAAAQAEMLDYNSTKRWFELSEARIGAGVTDPTTGHETSANLTGEVLLQPIGNASWYNILRVRPNAGINANLGGHTSFGYAGITFDLLNFDNVYLNGMFGGAVHTGRLHPGDADHKALGSRFEFHEGLELGYQFCPEYSVSTYVDHLSNAGWLSHYNQGIETAGVHFNKMF